MTTQKYDYHCGKCGGLVPEPTKTYSYSGRYCHCPEPTPATGKIINTTPAPTTQTEERARWIRVLANSNNPKDIDLLIAKVEVELTQERTRLKEEIERIDHYETHHCGYNDPPQSCDCYHAGIETALSKINK